MTSSSAWSLIVAPCLTRTPLDRDEGAQISRNALHGWKRTHLQIQLGPFAQLRPQSCGKPSCTATGAEVAEEAGTEKLPPAAGIGDLLFCGIISHMFLTWHFL